MATIYVGDYVLIEFNHDTVVSDALARLLDFLDDMPGSLKCRLDSNDKLLRGGEYTYMFKFFKDENQIRNQLAESMNLENMARLSGLKLASLKVKMERMAKANEMLDQEKSAFFGFNSTNKIENDRKHEKKKTVRLLEPFSIVSSERTSVSSNDTVECDKSSECANGLSQLITATYTPVDEPPIVITQNNDEPHQTDISITDNGDNNADKDSLLKDRKESVIDEVSLSASQTVDKSPNMVTPSIVEIKQKLQLLKDILLEDRKESVSSEPSEVENI